MFAVITLCVILGLGSGVFVGYSGKAFRVGVRANHGLTALQKSQFAVIADSSSIHMLEAAKKVKSIEQVKEPKMLELSAIAKVQSYVDISSLPVSLRRKATTVADALFAVQKLDNLSIEDAHDLNVVNEQLLTSVRLFESLPATRQSAKDVMAELGEQLDVLYTAVYDIRENYTENVVNQMKSNTGFLRSKFNKNNGLRLEKGK